MHCNSEAVNTHQGTTFNSAMEYDSGNPDIMEEKELLSHPPPIVFPSPNGAGVLFANRSLWNYISLEEPHRRRQKSLLSSHHHGPNYLKMVVHPQGELGEVSSSLGFIELHCTGGSLKTPLPSGFCVLSLWLKSGHKPEPYPSFMPVI